MDPALYSNMQDNLLTSSDIEHLMNDLGGNFEQFHQENERMQNFMPAEENGLDPLQEAYPNPPPLQNFMVVENVQEGMQMSLVPLPSQSPTCTIPCRDHYPGPLNFEVLLDGTTSSRKSWLYSLALNKVFIDMHKSLLVQFKLTSFEHSGGLSVRALPVYSMDDHVSEPVERCGVHILSEDELHKAHINDPPYCLCSEYHWVRHVVRSNHKEAKYFYDPTSKRHSVLVPLDPPQAGSDTATAEFSFACKTSCARGMNRRPIDVIFTLETLQGQVIGRYILPVKICSCPKRDKDKEEADYAAKSNQNRGKELGSRKRRMSSTEKQEEGLKKIKVERITPMKNGKIEEAPEDELNNQNDQRITNLAQTISAQTAQFAQIAQVLNSVIDNQRKEREIIMAQFNEITQQSNLLNNRMSALSSKVDSLLHMLSSGAQN